MGSNDYTSTLMLHDGIMVSCHWCMHFGTPHLYFFKNLCFHRDEFRGGSNYLISRKKNRSQAARNAGLTLPLLASRIQTVLSLSGARVEKNQAEKSAVKYTVHRTNFDFFFFQRLTLESWCTNLEQTPLNRCQTLPAPYKRLIHDINVTNEPNRTSVTTTDNSPSQDYTHPDDQTTLLLRFFY